MDEPTDPPPTPGTTPPLIAGAGRLSPVQQAWSDYVTHATHCAGCRSLRAVKCEQAERLWQAYQGSGEQAYQRLAEETP